MATTVKFAHACCLACFHIVILFPLAQVLVSRHPTGSSLTAGGGEVMLTTVRVGGTRQCGSRMAMAARAGGKSNSHLAMAIAHDWERHSA